MAKLPETDNRDVLRRRKKADRVAEVERLAAAKVARAKVQVDAVPVAEAEAVARAKAKKAARETAMAKARGQLEAADMPIPRDMRPSPSDAPTFAGEVTGEFHVGPTAATESGPLVDSNPSTGDSELDAILDEVAAEAVEPVNDEEPEA